ncbi:MAG: hypothetical protein ABJB01_03815 [Rudaea sp.]
MVAAKAVPQRVEAHSDAGFCEQNKQPRGERSNQHAFSQGHVECARPDECRQRFRAQNQQAQTNYRGQYAQRFNGTDPDCGQTPRTHTPYANTEDERAEVIFDVSFATFVNASGDKKSYADDDFEINQIDDCRNIHGVSPQI